MAALPKDKQVVVPISGTVVDKMDEIAERLQVSRAEVARQAIYKYLSNPENTGSDFTHVLTG